MEFKITKEQRDAVINYLGQRPYAEVFQLINVLLALEAIPAEAPAQMPPLPTLVKGSKKDKD